MHIGAESIDYTDSFFLSIDRFCKYITRNKPNLLPATIQKLRQFVTMFQTSLSDVDSNPSTVYIHLSPFLWSSSMFIRSGCCAAYLSSLLTCSMTHLLLSKHFTPSHKSFKTHPWIKSLVYPPSSSLPPSPLLILKPSYRPGLCWAKEVAKPGDLFCWCLLVTWTWSVCHLCTPPLLPHPSLASADSTWVFWTCTQLYPRPPCSLPSSWNKFCYISSRLLSTFSCHIGFLFRWRAWVSQCPSQTLMFRLEVA